MIARLTNELRDEIASHPRQAVPVFDDQNNKVYFLVDEKFLQGATEHDEQSRQRLLALLEEGFNGEEVSEKEGEARIRQKMQEITNKNV